MFRDIKVHAGFSRVLTKRESMAQRAYSKIDKISDYYRETGSYPNDKAESCPNNVRMYAWLKNMRIAKRGGSCHSLWLDEYLEYAIMIGLPNMFDSNPVPYDRIDQIKEYFDKYGKIPMQRESSLGRWIAYMKQAKKGQNKYRWDDGYLTYAIKIGLPNLFKERIEVSYSKIDQIKEYFDKYSKFPVGSLGKWIFNTRQAKKGKGNHVWDNKYLVYAIKIGLPKDTFDVKGE